MYSLTHTIRLLVVERCETTLSWEQLRSPQISQFLVKPVQNQIRTSHFSRATLYALLANCLQFKKEGQINPAIMGICETRAQLVELLAMRLLKDFNARELIDAFSYDFDPLSGQPKPVDIRHARISRRQSVFARTSTLEVAIRAQAKRFIAHPLVVRHLQSIWAGDIVFHSAADSLHRYPSRPKLSHERHYGAMHSPPPAITKDRPETVTIAHPDPSGGSELIRRSVTLYDPANASLFKLSRLRVPRYRQLFSTLSYAIMLGLFVAILVRRSLDLTPLEIVFWFWSAGFILDFVGFSEKGFGLYIASVWNVFDLGILVLFFIYYLLRLFSVLIAEATQQRRIANMAYDVLASTAILLFPRMFSLLDHYRYFSQLLIAFRLMAVDLAAVLVLIAIACSGFFVAFTLSFGQEDFDGRGVAYALFQILMGFTPAVWEVWDAFNLLGKGLLALFLVICHFLVVTILITVLTNSFMAIVKNANEEHQFLFAINTISMVKSDMLFSFIAPTNLIGWIIAPVRFCVSFPKYVFINRTLIKATHFPILFSIFAWERINLLRYPLEPADYLERRGRTAQRMPTFAINDSGHYHSHRLRMPSAGTFHKDQALEEVFRRPFDDGSVARKPRPSIERRVGGHNVDSWMSGLSEGGLSPPTEQPRSILEQLETTRPRLPRSMTSQRLGAKTRTATRSFMSDPEEGEPRHRMVSPRHSKSRDVALLGSDDGPAEADDEFTTNADTQERSTILHEDSDKENQKQYQDGHAVTATIKFREPKGSSPMDSTIRAKVLSSSPGMFTSSPPAGPSPSFRRHHRQSSTNTILFRPISEHDSSTSSPRPSPSKPPRRRVSRPVTALHSASHSGQNTPRRGAEPPVKRPVASRARPILPARDNVANKSVPNMSRYLGFTALSPQNRRAPSFDAIALDLASDIGDNRHNDAAGATFLPGSFQTQMQYATDALRRQKEIDDAGAMNKLVLARMNRIEEGFGDILRELRNSGSRGNSAGEDTSHPRKETGAKASRAARRLEEKAIRDARRKPSPARQALADPVIPGSLAGHAKTGDPSSGVTSNQNNDESFATT